MEIIEQSAIKSASDISKLGIIDWNRLNGYFENDVTQAIEIVTNCLGNHAKYTIIREDMRRYPQRDDWPGWYHTGNSHEPLGRMYWNLFRAHYPESELIFSDSPDFCGKLKPPTTDYPQKFYGDIGHVSASTFIFTLYEMREHDLWITIKSETTQVIIEPLWDIAGIVQAFHSRAMFGEEAFEKDIQEIERRALACPYCHPKLDTLSQVQMQLF